MSASCLFTKYIQTSMTTFIKKKIKRPDDQTNIVKYKVAANIRDFTFIKINLSQNHQSKIHDEQANISCKNIKNQHV